MIAQFVLFDGFDPLDALAPYEVLHTGGLASAGAVQVEFVSAEGAREVPSGVPGVSLRATAVLDPDKADLVVLPGASGRLPTGDERDLEDDAIPAILGRAIQTGLTALLKAVLEKEGVILATVCGGSLIPALAGLTGGRPATTNRNGGLDVLGATGTVAVDARVVDDNDLITASGVTSGLDLGLHLLDREIGPRVALAVERLFEYERRGIVWRADGVEPVAL
jgi:putative intracellular protease/amidase